MPTFDTPDPITATVELPIGELRVAASERADTTVTVHSAAEDRSEADAIRVELAGGELRVTGPRLGLLRQLTRRTPGQSIEVEIALPSRSALRVRSHYGGVRVEGALGDCAIDARYGDVRIEDAASAALSVGYGQARLAGTIDGDVDAVADFGGVHAHRVGGTATLRSKHGAIRADEIAGPARVIGTHADIDVDDVSGGADVRTVHGNVRLGRAARGKITMASSHGRLEVGIPPSSAAWLDLDTAGRITNDLAPRDDPSGFAETVSVYARSNDGAIVIRRAT